MGMNRAGSADMTRAKVLTTILIDGEPGECPTSTQGQAFQVANQLKKCGDTKLIGGREIECIQAAARFINSERGHRIDGVDRSKMGLSRDR